MLKNKLHSKFKKTEKGMAFIEAIPVLFMIVIVFNFSLGFFGAIHSGILNSIASYNYTMETFRFRSNLMYFRPGDQKMAHYTKSMNRVHGVTGDGIDQDDTGTGTSGPSLNTWPATVRSIAFTSSVTKLKDGEESKGAHIYVTGAENDRKNVWGVKSDVSPDSETDTADTPEIWVKTVYGICLNAECKP